MNARIPAMKKCLSAVFGLGLLASASVALAHDHEVAAPGKIGIQIANYMMATWPTLDDTTCGSACFSLDYSKVPAAPNPKFWEYTNTVPLTAIWKLYQHTGNVAYFNYVKSFVDTYIDATGKINYGRAYPAGSTPNDPTIQDVMQPAFLLPGLYKETGDVRYLNAMASVRQVYATLKTNPGGGFWHKPTYPNQQWLDAIYMSEPFITKYAALYADDATPGDSAVLFNAVTNQIKIAADHTFNPDKKLYYHGWNGATDGIWLGLDPKKGKVPPVTGTVVSPILWSRSIAWYMLGTIDVLDYLPKNHPDRPALLRVVRNIAHGLRQYQDPKSGMWYQVIDQMDGPVPANGGYPGETVAAQPNWIETSASALFTYGLAKAVRKGYIDEDYMRVAHKAWKGVKTQVTIDASNKVTVHRTVVGMSIGGNYNAYVNADFREDLNTGDLPAPAASCSAAQLPGGFPTTFTSAPLVCKYIFVRPNVPQGLGAVMLASSEMEFGHSRGHNRH